MAKVDTRRHIGDILVQRGIITDEQLSRALTIQDKSVDDSPRRLGQILSAKVGIDRHLVMKAISEIYAFREVNLDAQDFSNEYLKSIKNLISKLPKNVVEELMLHEALPYSTNNDHIIIATSDPTDPVIPNLAEKLNYKHYELAYCRAEGLSKLINLVYQQKNEFLELLDEINIDQAEIIPEDDEIDEEEIDAEINQSMLTSLVEGMLIEAVHQGASDIHIVPKDHTTSHIHFRIDGKLKVWHTVEHVKPEALTAVIKDKSRNVDRFERDSSQDGFIQRKIDSNNIRYRVSIMPIVGQEFDRKFESVVIRVLDDRKVITDLEKLGLQKKAKENFVRAINKPSGIVIITGPTGSGKSTTLVAALYSVIDPTKNVLTVEEPVEYLINGARQLKINNHMTFDQSMRGILRHDPDIVLVGEIRDLKTAEIAIKLANTGHLTFSTLHTNDAPSVISRLYKMGVEPFLIANAVNLVMAQRLVRKLCDHCKEEVKDIEPEYAKGLGFTNEEIEKTKFYKPVGCDHCHGGYKGRVAIMEALYFSKEIKKMILTSGNDIDEDMIREQAIQDGMLTLRASGRERIKEGLTTIEEIAAITVGE